MIIQFFGALLLLVIVPGAFVWSLLKFRNPPKFRSGFAKLFIGIVGVCLLGHGPETTIAGNMFNSLLMAIAATTASCGLIDLISIKVHSNDKDMNEGDQK